MEFSKHGVALLKELEGYSKTVYLDTGRAPTIGVGHLLTKDERRSGKIRVSNESFSYHKGLEDWQVEALLHEDLRATEWVVNRLVKVDLTQSQYDALCCWTFNCGREAFAHSTLLKVLNRGQYDSVPEQMRRWVYDNGAKVQGLENRREKEISLWNRPQSE